MLPCIVLCKATGKPRDAVYAITTASLECQVSRHRLKVFKKVGEEFHDLLLQTEWFHSNFNKVGFFGNLQLEGLSYFFKNSRKILKKDHESHRNF